MSRKSERNLPHKIRERVLGEAPKPFAPRRLAREGFGFLLIQAGTGIGGVTGSLLEAGGLALTALRSHSINRARRELNDNPPEVSLPWIINAVDFAGVSGESLIPAARTWQADQKAQLDDRIQDLQSDRYKEKRHALIYPAVVGLAKAGVMVGAEIAKTAGLIGITHPELYVPALLAIGPVGWALLGVTVIASGFIGWLGLKYYDGMIKRYKNEKDTVDYVEQEAEKKLTGGGGLRSLLDSIVDRLPAGVKERLSSFVGELANSAADRSRAAQ